MKNLGGKRRKLAILDEFTQVSQSEFLGVGQLSDADGEIEAGLPPGRQLTYAARIDFPWSVFKPRNLPHCGMLRRAGYGSAWERSSEDVRDTNIRLRHYIRRHLPHGGEFLDLK